jgi:asparagine synthase (glutamine-hydrolysing)
MSMAHGVEIRVPFLDRRIMEFAGRVDAGLLTPILGRDKKILRHALRRAGGETAIVRAKKRGFNVPIAHHLRHGLRDLGERLLNRTDALEPYLARNAASGLWREHAENRANHGYALWTLLTLAAWCDAAGVQ